MPTVTVARGLAYVLIILAVLQIERGIEFLFPVEDTDGAVFSITFGLMALLTIGTYRLSLQELGNEGHIVAVSFLGMAISLLIGIFSFLAYTEAGDKQGAVLSIFAMSIPVMATQLGWSLVNYQDDVVSGHGPGHILKEFAKFIFVLFGNVYLFAVTY